MRNQIKSELLSGDIHSKTESFLKSVVLLRY